MCASCPDRFGLDIVFRQIFITFYTPPQDSDWVLWFHFGSLCVCPPVHPSVIPPSVCSLFLDDNLSNHQSILTKPNMCIDIVGWHWKWATYIIFWQSYNDEILSFHVFISYCEFKKDQLKNVGGVVHTRHLFLTLSDLVNFWQSYLPATHPYFCFQTITYQQIFTKLSMCIVIVDIRLGIANGQILSTFDRVICSPYDNGKVLSFHDFISYCELWKDHSKTVRGDAHTKHLFLTWSEDMYVVWI